MAATHGRRWGDVGPDYFWHHFPPSYYRDPEEELEAMGYDVPDWRGRDEPPQGWEP